MRLNLIPAVKALHIHQGFLTNRAICPPLSGLDERLRLALNKLPQSESGTPLEIRIADREGESYTLSIREDRISIEATGTAGAFYAIQTLRQIFTHAQIPCLEIEDAPDFAYRGFYHDVTRGKIPTVETLKNLIDRMAYHKLNSLQLYVEHTYEFEEYKALRESTGCLTKAQMLEIGAYCRENFIDFVPSLSTFGHLFELLEQPQYRHLQVRRDCEPLPNRWRARMMHHTIDPQNPQSIDLIGSLIDQYVPLFDSGLFNICCDETFDLHSYDAQGVDSGKLYVDFVKKIIAQVKKHGKQVMMWADILLKYPETIDQIPEDILFLNWCYDAQPKEEQVIRLAKSGRKQIVCPGTTSWSRLCENVGVAEQNISRMVEYGRRHGAVGVLNTNWGDWGNPCSLELATYGLVLGAEKSWSAETAVDEDFCNRVNALVYQHENGVQTLKTLSRMHDLVDWDDFCSVYYYHRYGHRSEKKDRRTDAAAVQKLYGELVERLSAESWVNDEFRQEMLLAAEGVCVMAELWAKLLGEPVSRLTDTRQWLKKYAEKWLEKNQPNELYRIQEMFCYCEDV